MLYPRDFVIEVTIYDRSRLSIAHGFGIDTRLNFDVVPFSGLVWYKADDCVSRFGNDHCWKKWHQPSGRRALRFKTVKVCLGPIAMLVALHTKSINLGLHCSDDALLGVLQILSF